MKTILRNIPRAVLVGILVAALLVTGALAYLSASGGTVSNTFSAAPDSEPTIDESFVDNFKTDVKVDVGNPGYAVYVRAAIVVNWEQNGIDSDGNKTITSANTGIYHATAPVAGTDYTISLNTAPDGPWFLGTDGFYYHKAMVSSDATSNLIETCKVVSGKAPDGYHLDVKIIAQTIQALGTTDNDANGDPVAVGIPAVEDAWKVVTVGSNNELVPKT